MFGISLLIFLTTERPYHSFPVRTYPQNTELKGCGIILKNLKPSQKIFIVFFSIADGITYQESGNCEQHVTSEVCQELSYYLGNDWGGEKTEDDERLIPGGCFKISGTWYYNPDFDNMMKHVVDFLNREVRPDQDNT